MRAAEGRTRTPKGAGEVYRTPLCAPLDALVRLARARVGRALTAEERALYLRR